MTRVLVALAIALLTLDGASVLSAQRQGGQGADPTGARAGGPGQGRGDRFPFRGRGELLAGTASIRGRVVAADTGTPVRRAQVRAALNSTPQARLVSTDANGRFELTDLPAGQWSLSASKPGFVTQRFGQRRAYETVAPIELADGQRFDASFQLARGGAITGRVVDDFGDPVANARVQVLRSQMVNGKRRLTQVGVADESDDIGAFRLYGLAPGEYYVSARLRANPNESSNDQTSYAPTYFPGTGDVAQAQRIRIGVGEETSVSFALQPVRTVRVSGTVVSSSGAELNGGLIALTRSADTDEVAIDTNITGRIFPDGTFTIPNVAPGSYILSVRAGPRFAAGRGSANAETDMAALPLVVGDSDVTGLAVPTTRGAFIEGTIVFEGSSTRPALTGLQVTARSLRQSGAVGGGSNVRVAPDGTFRLTSLLGQYNVRVDGLSQQWILKSIVLSETDVTDTPLELRGNEQITGARIVLTDRITEVNGTATLGGRPASDYTVVVFPDEAERWTFPTRYIRTARKNQQGGFSLRGLPPSSRYLAVAVDYLEDGEFQDPEFLSLMRDKATSLSLRDGETRTIELRMVER